MNTTPIKIGGRTFALAFPLSALERMQEMHPDFDVGRITDHARTPSGLLDLLTVMATEGEQLEGRTLDVDRAWFGARIPPAPAKVARIQIAVLNALTKWLTMETEDDEEFEHDVVLEEIKKKEATGT